MKIFSACLLMSSFVCWADVPPRDSSGCREKKVGDTCQTDDGQSGTCMASTCTRMDYSQGIPPKAISYDCLKCSLGEAQVIEQPKAISTETPAPTPLPEKKKNSCNTAPAIGLMALVSVVLRRRSTA